MNVRFVFANIAHRKMAINFHCTVLFFGIDIDASQNKGLTFANSNLIDGDMTILPLRDKNKCITNNTKSIHWLLDVP